MTIAERVGPIVGRAEELARLRAELALARSGTPRVLVVQGDAGIGKTALLEHLLDAESELITLRATGEPWEAFVAYGIIDQLLREAGVSTSRLQITRDRSLPAEEPVGVGAWLLEVVGELQRRQPVAIVVDDAHWADMDSLRALLFAARRLVDQRVVVLLGQRTEDRLRLPEGLRRMAEGRSGTTLDLEPMPPADVQQLASSLGVPDFSGRAAQRLHAHTGGNPLYVKTMLTELPEQRWRAWDASLPAPRAFAAQVRRRLEACTEQTRALVESVAVLGTTASVRSAATLAGVSDLVEALDEAASVRLLTVREHVGIREVGFPHPLVQAAVYEQLGPLRRVQLHSAAAEFVEEEGALLRHRVLAATPPDPKLAADLEGFARREAAVGAWASAAWALVEGSSLSPEPDLRERRLLRAVDATIGAGDLLQAEVFARDIAATSGAWRDAALGYLAVLRARRAEAEQLLLNAWELAGRDTDASVAAVVAQRLALNGVGRLRGHEVVSWARRAIEVAEPDDPVRIEAEALLGLGLGWEGRIEEGLATYEAVLGRVNAAEDGPQLERIRMAHSWLRMVRGDVVEARAALAMTAPAALRAGSVRIAVWAFSWLAYAEFTIGAWDDAAESSEQAVSLLDESGMEWLRPLARYVAALVPACRGEWAVAEEHLWAGVAQPGDYELMVVTAGLARAELAAARADHDGVLRALDPVAGIHERAGIDEPGFWPWADRYVDALVGVGRLDEAEVLLDHHERLAAERGRTAMIARLGRVRGRLEAARGRLPEAKAAFEAALEALDSLAMPFQLAQTELAYGQVLRRGGSRRVAANRLRAARDRFAALRATPYLERTERELRGCGLAPAKRSEFDPTKLTAQEQAVAGLVAVGMSNRQVAAELYLSVKTVQFHLTHVYAKLGVSSRAELAAQFRD